MPRLPANGAIDLGGFNEPTVVGAVPIGDESDATYMDFQSSPGNATVGIAVPTGVVLLPIILHVRFRVLVDDPTDFAGEGEIFLNTDADGGADTEIASFSNGAVSGFGFNIPAEAVSETVEVAESIRLGPQWPTTVDEVYAALYAGAYLDFNSWNWTGGSFEPTFRVYEAWLEYTAPTSIIPPRRIFQRSDGATHGATRVFGGGNTAQRGNRRGPGSIL